MNKIHLNFVLFNVFLLLNYAKGIHFCPLILPKCLTNINKYIFSEQKCASANIYTRFKYGI